jgi:hypothetical protein
MLKPKIGYLIVASCLVCSCPTLAAPVGDTTAVGVSHAMQQLRAFESAHSFTELNDAITSLYTSLNLAQGGIVPANYVARRRTYVQAWAQILKTIEQSYDPTFDPKNPVDLPSICLMSPQATSPTCFDYKSIKDPVARTKMIAAIQANNVKREKAAYWTHLVLADQDAMASLDMQLKEFRTAGAPPDIRALDAIILQAGISDARRAKLDAMFASP